MLTKVLVTNPMGRQPSDEETDELDGWARQAFNPDDMIDVVLPSGAVARVAPDVPLETLAALDRMAALMIEQATGGRGAAR